MPWIRKIHKWASVIIGVQLLLWLLSGIYFNLMDHTKSIGHTYKNHVQQNVDFDNSRLIEPSEVLSNFNASISLESIQRLGTPYYLLTHKKGLSKRAENHYTLVNAYTGVKTIIDEALANQLAQQSYNGPGSINSAQRLSPPLADFPRQKNAAWQINFDDEIDTRVYIDAGSGRIIGHSDAHKRFADIFFMLHFMDYGNDSSFNNIQIILFAFVTLWLSLSGLIWTIDLGLRGQYKIKYFAKHQGVKLFDKNQNSIGTVALSNHRNLLHGLIDHDIVLPSNCGGGGTCGLCKVLINPIVRTTSADHLHFTNDELQQGYRLACQHFSDDVDQMTLIDVTDAKKHRLKLSESRFISPFIKELRFEVLSDSAFTFKAGAFMRFFIPAATGTAIPQDLPEDFKAHWHAIEQLEYEHLACTRSYSLAESSLSTDELVFTIKIQTAPNHTLLPGTGSGYLGNLAVGKTIEALGPFEEFYARKNSDKTMVLLGAGSGMAPLRAIIDEQITLANNTKEEGSNCGRNLHFFYGARTESDLLYADKFYQLAEKNNNFHYYPTLSQANNAWLGANGYVQQLLLLHFDNLIAHVGDIENLEFYLCGPKEMMTASIEILKAKGVKDSSIAFDSFA